MQIHTTVQEMSVRPGQRVIALTDIHGHAENLMRVLEKVKYSGSDVLAVTGDVVDKGPESLRTVRCLMRLAQVRPVYVSMGNVDLSRLDLLLDDTQGSGARLADFLHWQRRVWGGGMLLEMCAEASVDYEQVTAENAEAVRERLCAQFAQEIAFLRSRPTVLTMGQTVFVHGGVPTDNVESLVGTDARPWLQNDSFYTQGYRFSHCVAVGHWPVSLYRADREEYNPLFDYDRRILCMDGGCGLKLAGQLNAVIFPEPDAPMERLKWVSADSLPTVTALSAQTGAPPTFHINYLNSAVEWLGQEQNGLVQCRHIETGREVWLPETFLYHRGDNWATKDVIDTRLDVRPGDVLSVLWCAGDTLYAKRGGVCGWYTGKWQETPLPDAPPLERFL